MKTRVMIGRVDVSEHVADVKVVSALNKPNSATFRLLVSATKSPIVDYNAQVAISTLVEKPDDWSPPDSGTWRTTKHHNIYEHLLFGGLISEAIANGDDVDVSCTGGFTELTDSDLGRLFTNISDQERAYSIFRLAGISDESLSLEGFDSLPEESFEVVVPLNGVAPWTEFSIGRVYFYPSDSSNTASEELTDRLFSGTGKETELKQSFFASDGLARVVTRSRSLCDAEQHGLSLIDEALDWATVRVRDARAQYEDRLMEFDRSVNLARPRRRGLVAVHGVTTSRSWIRVPDRRTRDSVLSVTESSSFLASALQQNIDFATSQALAALSRAHTSSHETTSILALWESLEFYSGETTVTPMFDKAEKKDLRRRLKDQELNLTEEQSQRLSDVLGNLNNAPLFVRLRQAAINDAVPFTEDEFEVLKELRKARNSAVHGNVASPLKTDALKIGLSFASRMLVQRMLRRDEPDNP